MCIKIWLSMHPRNFGCAISSVNAYVVVNFLSQVIFVFFWFLGIVNYVYQWSWNKRKRRITSDKKLTTTHTPVCMYILIFTLSWKKNNVNVTLTSMLLSIDGFQDRVPTDQYDMTLLQAQMYSLSRWCFLVIPLSS